MSMQAGKQEEDKIESRPMFVVTAVVIAIMILTYIGVVKYVVQQTAGHTPSAQSLAAIKVQTASNGEPIQNSQIPQFGMLHQTLLNVVSDAKDLDAVTNQRAHSQGWNDEKKTSAHLPVDVAMERIIQQRAQPAGK